MMARCLPILCLTVTLVHLQAQDLQREAYNRYGGSSTYTFPAQEGGQLSMENVRGDIVITGVSSQQVEIVETVSVRAVSEERAAQLYKEVKAAVKRISAEGKPLAIVISGNRSRERNVSFDYSIRVPSLFSLKVDSRGGDVEVTDIKGQVDLTSGGGDLDLSHVSGKVSGSTSGGDINAYDLGGRVSLNTSGGDVDVHEMEGELTLSTSGGDISVDRVRGGVSVTTAGGDIDLSKIDGHEIVGRTSGGDITAVSITGRVDLSTSGGNVTAEDIQGDLDASTSGGDIEMERIRGSADVWTSAGVIIGNEILGGLNARTSAGDIVVRKGWNSQMDKHDIELITSVGDIELTLPESFPGSFSARVFSPDMRPGESIISDFPLSITASQSVARAEGTVEDGRYTVTLESTLGTITILREN